MLITQENIDDVGTLKIHVLMMMKIKNKISHVFIVTFFLECKATRYMILLVFSKAQEVLEVIFMGSSLVTS